MGQILLESGQEANLSGVLSRIRPEDVKRRRESCRERGIQVEWVENRLDDALFESMLSPLVRQALERIFLSEKSSQDREAGLCGIYVLHRELGLILQNDESRTIFPKVLPGESWEDLSTYVEGAIIPSGRPEFRAALEGDTPSFQESWPLLPDRISRASNLFVWTARFDWGRVMVLKTSPEGNSGKDFASFKERAGEFEAFLRSLLDQWMLDATLEVFWGRILGNIPAQFTPLRGSASPEWRRTLPVPVSGDSGGEVELLLAGDYWKSPGEGWMRTLRKESRKKESLASQPRAGAGEGGESLVVPVDLWGLFPLGDVRFRAEIVRKFDVPDFLQKLRRARALALRSLYRHLLYPGRLSILSFWIPEAECFDQALVGELPVLVDPAILDDAFVTLILPSDGYRKGIEGILRPADLLFRNPRKPGRISLLLRNCTPERAKNSVFPRVLRIEGLTEKNLEGVVSVREFLASQGISPSQ